MLQPGQRLKIAGKPYEVQYVNATGAWIVPLEKKRVQIGNREFFATQDGMLVSADTQVAQ